MPPAPLENPPRPAKPAPRGTLTRQLHWIVSLRWLAGATVIVGGMADLFWLHWYGRGRHIAAVGAIILIYNLLFWTLGRRNGRIAAPRTTAPNGNTYWLVWAQILADLACLTALVNWTGGYDSPLRALFVLHMVFASLLLPRPMAFGVALVAIGMVEGVLAISNLPAFGAAGIVRHSPQQVAVGVGWDATLLATVYLASRVARDMRRQGRRLARQNARIRRMAERLRRQQEALLQHEKMFALGQMAAGVAHEVANPLASMDGLLQLLERRPEKVSPENLARLREQVARINQIVRQLTTFARAERADLHTGEWREESLNAVVTHGLEVLRFDERLKKMTVERRLDERLPPVRMQSAAIEQVLVNLMLNAADALEGAPAPKVVVKTEAAAGWVEMSVADNGPGMTDEVRARIFEPFFTTKAVGKGTGLGLSVSYSLVKKHGGEILVDSTVGNGAVFRVRLPA
jgi:signal transduction histidine kinase